MDEVDLLKKKLSEAAKVTALVGTFVGVDSGQAFVDVGGGRIPASVLGTLPQVADPVHVWFVNSQPFIMGPTALQPTTGTVVGIDGMILNVSTVAGSFFLPYLAWYTPALGNAVKIAWGDMPIVLGLASVDVPAPPKPPAPGGGGSSTKVSKFTAIDSGSWDSRYGWYQRQIWASDSYTGAAFFGTKIRDTLKGRTCDKFEVFISPVQIQGSVPNFVTHTSARKPSGNVSVANTTPKAVKAGWVTLPKPLGQWLIDHVGGLGVNHGGYNIFRSIDQDPQSFALRFTTH